MRNLEAAILGGVALIVSTFAPVSAAVSQPELYETLIVRYGTMRAAMAAHNNSALAALLAPGFTSIDVAGNIETATNMIAGLDALKSDLNKTSRTTLTSVREDGDTAIVDQRYEMHTVRAGADGALHRVDLVTLSTDVWFLQSGSWLLAKTTTTELTSSFDGKVVAHEVAR